MAPKTEYGCSGQKLKKTNNMKSNLLLCTNLKTVMQHETLLREGQSYNGVLSLIDDDWYLFEESVRRSRPALNPKLFEGLYLSLTKRKDGRYYVNMKSIDRDELADPTRLAAAVYRELLQALINTRP